MAIEKNIPVPRPRSKYTPYDMFDVGDSEFHEKYSTANRVAVYGNKAGYKFVTRKVQGGFRVWRVE